MQCICSVKRGSAVLMQCMARVVAMYVLRYTPLHQIVAHDRHVGYVYKTLRVLTHIPCPKGLPPFGNPAGGPFGSRADWRQIPAHQVGDSSPSGKTARRYPRRPETALPWPPPEQINEGGQPMPRKPADGQKLTRPVSFRLTDTDHAAYLAKVEASGLKPSEFFRECVLQNRTQVVARVPTSSDKRRLLYLFNKTSNNMNQLAHAANAAELAGTATPATYAGILAELQAIADAMREAVEHAD